MCKVYNPVGALTTIRTHLAKHKVTDLNSLDEVLSFQQNYSHNRQEVFSNHEQLLKEEKDSLRIEISALDSFIKSKKIHFENVLRTEINKLNHQRRELADNTAPGHNYTLAKYLKAWYYQIKIQYAKVKWKTKETFFTRKSVTRYNKKNNRYQYLLSRFEDALKESCSAPLAALETKKRVIDEIKPFIFGALGEEEVVKELENLPDDYYLINDFALVFAKPIYYRQENEHIRSIQIDHILVGPAGVFLIETKNWSEKSINNPNLRSPVRQVKRTGFALFKLLHDNHSNLRLLFAQHHWGNRKIPIRNIVVLGDKKIKEEFPYVKMLTIDRLLGYVHYFAPAFSGHETREIAKYLLKLSGKDQQL